MPNKQFALAGLWMTAIVFAAITLVTYHNDLYNDGSMEVGFPFVFYRKSYGMNISTGEMGMAVSVKPRHLVKDMVIATLLSLGLLVLWNRFKKQPDR
ncbi:hypothetical protein SAMN04488128_10354 [Chitinophaga eiseniae]|uniref:Uncharacterized protein n=1 Tax=Chitinophaga eiseniae TaxID=634771 RepID=A0A1T4SL96_9BACT|nr:hypothetical protein [Chitinophaga eiseniae]SKA29060.1 hypothetical protein SAMN04488128_10354 [Chitinophaga eiseniae]